MPAYAPTFNREDLLQAPAHIVISKAVENAWKYLWCDGTVTAMLPHDDKIIKVAGFGEIDQVKTDERVEADFTPAGNMDQDVLDWMFRGILAKRIGSCLFEAADTPAYIHSLDGRLLTLTCAAVTTYPTLLMGIPNQRFEGSAKLTGIIGNGLARSVEGALFLPFYDAPFVQQPVPSEWGHLPVRATWEGLLNGLDVIEIESEAGWKINVGVALKPVKAANLGTINYKITGIVMTASCRPLNLSEVQLFSAKVIGGSRLLGTGVTGTTLTLAEDYGGITAVLNGAKMTAAPVVFDEDNPRAGECVWTAYRDFSSGMLGVPGSIAMTAAPE
jgi:hypothetical protein